jgi:hypothetical protein
MTAGSQESPIGPLKGWKQESNIELELAPLTAFCIPALATIGRFENTADSSGSKIFPLRLFLPLREFQNRSSRARPLPQTLPDHCPHDAA